MHDQLEQARERLSAKDHKFTPQRAAVFKVFWDNKDKHLSAEDVFLLVKKDFPEIGLATVYRTLELFEELDILHELNLGDGRSRYEFSPHEEHHHHHHLLCLNCGKIMEVKTDLLETLENNIRREYKFFITDHQVKFYGYCEECQESRHKK